MARTLFTINLASILDTDDAIAVGSQLFFFEENGVTEATTYTTSDGSTQNTNPLLAQGDGRFAQQAWLEPGTYVYALVEPGGTMADPWFTGEFIASNALTDVDPDLEPFLAGDDPLPIASGGTGQTSAPNALNALGGLSTDGGEVDGEITRNGSGAYMYWDTAAMNMGAWFITVDSDPDPTSNPGEVWAKYA